eukprot:SAG31_NODE_3615_length_4066_cov_3.735316_1_plen_116_part_00
MKNILGIPNPGSTIVLKKKSAAKIRRQQRREAERKARAVDAAEQPKPVEKECCNSEEERWIVKMEDGLAVSDVAMIERAMEEMEAMAKSGGIVGQDGVTTARGQSRVFDPGGAEE